METKDYLNYVVHRRQLYRMRKLCGSMSAGLHQTGQYSISDRAGTLPALWELHDGLSCGSGGKKVKFNA